MDLFTLVARLSLDSSDYEKGISKARGSFSEFGNSIGAKAVAIGNMVSRGVEKAVNIAADLGRSAIQNAADVTAEKAQFKATFGELQGSADKAFKDIEKSTGVFGTRLKNVGTKAFSQFKGAGLDGVDALSMMTDYTKLAADAAAYYDISLEDADARLRSFLRGNTEAGDAIGLFTSESQRNSAAMEKYGQKWQALTEAQKQMLMLDISKDIYEQSGAIGQAARESDSWTNIVGNLKEVWRQATALIGAPIVSAITPVIQDITTFLQDEGIQTKFTQFGLTIGTITSATFDGINGFIDKVTQTGTGENQLFSGIADFADGVIKIASSTIDSAILFVDGLARLLGIEGASDFLTNAGTFFSDLGTFGADHAEEISTMITALLAFMAVTNPFALFIVALTTIVGNWEDMKTLIDKCETAFFDFVNAHVPEEYLNAAKAGWDALIGKIEAAINAVGRFFGFSTPREFGGGSGGGEGAGRTFGEPAGNAGGMFYTKNNYIARLHEGEAILNSREAAEWRAGKTGSAGASASEIAAAVAQALDGAFVDMDKEHVGRLVLPTVSREMAASARNRRYEYG